MGTEAGLLIWCNLSFSSMLAANNGAPFSHSSLSATRDLTDLFVSHSAATYQTHVWNESPFSGHAIASYKTLPLKHHKDWHKVPCSFVFFADVLHLLHWPGSCLTKISVMLVSLPIVLSFLFFIWTLTEMYFLTSYFSAKSNSKSHLKILTDG